MRDSDIGFLLPVDHFRVVKAPAVSGELARMGKGFVVCVLSLAKPADINLELQDSGLATIEPWAARQRLRSK